MILEPLEEKVFDTDVLFRVEHSGIYYSLHFDQLLISVLIAINYKSNPLRGRLRNVLIYGYKDKYLQTV